MQRGIASNRIKFSIWHCGECGHKQSRGDNKYCEGCGEKL